MRQKYMLINLSTKGVKSMLLTKTLIKFNSLLVKIPKQTKRVWDLAENRWGYKKSKKTKFNFKIFYYLRNGDLIVTISII